MVKKFLSSITNVTLDFESDLKFARGFLRCCGVVEGELPESGKEVVVPDVNGWVSERKES